MKSAAGALSTIFVAGLITFGCAPSDPVEGGGTGGLPAGSGGGNLSTGGNNGSGGAGTGGSMGSGGSVGSGGSLGSSGGSGTGGRAAGTGGRSSSGGTPGSGGMTTTGSGGRGSGGASSGGTMGGGSGGAPGTGGGSMGGSGSGTSFAAVATILGNSCGTGTCHQGGTHVDLRNNAGLRGRLVGVMVSGTATMAACRTKTLVVASDTANSVLSQVVKAKLTGCTNARMPDECSTTSTTPRACLTTAQIATIDGWISAGAQP